MIAGTDPMAGEVVGSEAPRKLKVIHVSHTVENGGAELALSRLLAAPARDWDATLILPSGQDLGAFVELADSDISILQIGTSHAPGASKAGVTGIVKFAGQVLRQAWSLRRSGVFSDADVVHANSTRAALYCAVALLGRRQAFVVHLRDRIEPEAIGSFGYRAFRYLIARKATAFISNSKATSETIAPFRRKSQTVSVIPSPIGLELARDPLPPADGAVRIGMVARIDPWKGQEELLRAFAKADLGPDSSLTFVGSPAFGHDNYLVALKKLAHELDLKNVHFPGFTTDVEGAVDSLDICVQYSIRPEPLGQNVLQYLARARVVIAADEGGPAEWISTGSTGFLVEPRSINALAAALAQVASDFKTRADVVSRLATQNPVPADAEIVAAHSRAFAAAHSSLDRNHA